jgi:hypothetical protein
MTKQGLIKGNRRTEILSKNFGICVYCNEAPSEHVDHILPRSWKVNNDDNNLVGACADCNHIASDKIFDSFEKKQAYILEQLSRPKWKKRRVKPYEFKPLIEKLKPLQKRVLKISRSSATTTEQEILIFRKELNKLLENPENSKVGVYTKIAKDLSRLAGLKTEWSWRYVASSLNDTVTPGKKFDVALAAYVKKTNLRKRQWFYFKKYLGVAAIYDKAILSENIRNYMFAMGYTRVTYSRYMQVKKGNRNGR